MWVCLKTHTLHNITHIGVACKERVTDEQRWGWQKGRAARGARWPAGSVYQGEHGSCYSCTNKSAHLTTELCLICLLTESTNYSNLFCEVKMWPPCFSCGMWCSSRAGGEAAWKTPLLQTATCPWWKAGKHKMWWEKDKLLRTHAMWLLCSHCNNSWGIFINFTASFSHFFCFCFLFYI